jgi:hypothetical protein
MKIPIKVWITLAIIGGIGLGTGSLTVGLLLPTSKYGGEAPPIMIAIGAMLLAASTAALIAHLAGGFRDIDNE